jgi:glycosyltransferase involved in cell wall biosynthesis
VRILQITSARALGGGETHFVDLATGLYRRGHEVHVALATGSPVREALLATIPERNLIALPLRNALDVPSARRLAGILRERKIELVHAHMARDYPLAAFAVKRNKGARLVLTRHVLFPMNRLQALALANVSRVIAVSEAGARVLCGQRLFPAEKIVVVLNGIDVERFAAFRTSFDRGRFCRSRQIPQDRPLVGAVGEITKLKGHEDFVRAAALIRTRVPDAHFIIAGQDHTPKQENEAALNRLIAELDLAGRVQRFGWLDNLAELYCALDMFVSASHSESFGLAIVEAMASGTPVVATATEGARELIEDGVSGKLAPIENAGELARAVADLLEDSQERKRLAVAGQLRAKEHFGLHRMIEQTEQVYRSAFLSEPPAVAGGPQAPSVAGSTG